MLANWNDANFNSFTWSMNGGLGELQLTLARPIDSFGEEQDVAFNNQVQVLVSDVETAPEGRKVYSGFIESYEQVLRGNREEIVVNCMGYQAKLANRILEDSTGNTTITYSSVDPAYIIKDVIEKSGIDIAATSATVVNTGTTVSYTFRNNTVMEALQQAVELAGPQYYWYVDPENVLYFERVDFNKAVHKFVFGKDFNQARVIKDGGNIRTRVFFVGGGDPNMYRKYARTAAQLEHGTLDHRITDQRVTITGTAEQFATSYLDKHDHLYTTIQANLVDSNITSPTNKGFDIERLRPGQVVELQNFTEASATLWDVSVWDVDFWDYSAKGTLANPFIVQNIQYTKTSAVVTLGEILPSLARVIQDIDDKVDSTAFETLPSSPT